MLFAIITVHYILTFCKLVEKNVEKKVWFSNQVLSVKKIKKIDFIQAVLKLETLLYQNIYIYILFHHI